MMVADFTQPGRACSGVFGLWGSCRGLAVLGSCSAGVQHPLRARVARWATANPKGSSLGQPNSEGLSENVGSTFHSTAKLLLSFLDCGSSFLGLVVLGHCSAGVRHPPWAGVATWAAANPRGSSPGQPNSEVLSENIDRSFHGLAKLVLAFLGCRHFPGGWRCLVFLHGGIAPPKSKKARAGTAHAVVGFQKLLRPALPCGRKP